MEITCIPVDVSWFPNTRSSGFSDVLAFLFLYRALVLDYVISTRCLNHRLTHIHCLLKRSCLLFSWTIIRSIIPLGGSNSPPLHYIRRLSGFLRYLYSFGCIYCRIRRLSDTFIITECVYQIICNILQNYYFLNLQFNFFVHGSEDMELSAQFISKHSEWYL
jgi:hypothetical protein